LQDGRRRVVGRRPWRGTPNRRSGEAGSEHGTTTYEHGIPLLGWTPS
jgi:hypothetical protein